MKLNQFFTKPVVAKKRTSVFQLGNESREKDLEAEIRELQQIIQDRESLEVENADLKASRESGLREIKTLRKDYNVIQGDFERQQLLVEELTEIKIKYDQTVAQIKNLTGELEQHQTFVSAAQSNNVKQQVALDTLQEQHLAVSLEHKELTHEQGILEHSLSEQGETIKHLTTIVERLDKFSEDLQEENMDLKVSHSEAIDQMEYWRATAGAFADQVDEFQTIEARLNKWITKLTEQTEQEVSKSKGAKKRLVQNQALIAEMNGTIEEMAGEQESLQERNIELQTQMAKPSYASFGTIERLENFAMTPMGAALNINKLYLGNAKPTLLKFKPRGTKENDNEE